jgi:hypothetical protein
MWMILHVLWSWTMMTLMRLSASVTASPLEQKHFRGYVDGGVHVVEVSRDFDWAINPVCVCLNPSAFIFMRRFPLLLCLGTVAPTSGRWRHLRAENAARGNSKHPNRRLIFKH